MVSNDYDLLDFFVFRKDTKTKVYKEFNDFDDENKAIFFLILLSAYKPTKINIIVF